MLKKNKNFEDFEEKKNEKSKISSESIKKYLSKNAVSLVILAVSALAFAVSAAMIPQAATYEINTSGGSTNIEGDAPVPAELSARDSEIRIFREYGGKVGVFFKDGELDFVVDVEVSSLSEYDRELLSKGVIADGSEEITLLVEGLTERN